MPHLKGTVGRSFESRLHSVMRCRAVFSAFSGQVQSGVGAFFILWTYERKQPWFVRSCVRKCWLALPGDLSVYDVKLSSYVHGNALSDLAQ